MGDSGLGLGRLDQLAELLVVAQNRDVRVFLGLIAHGSVAKYARVGGRSEPANRVGDVRLHKLRALVRRESFRNLARPVERPRTFRAKLSNRGAILRFAR
jgi:hypothetical protein